MSKYLICIFASFDVGTVDHAKYEIERDINEGLVSNKQFKKIVSEEVMDNYSSIVNYLGF